MDQNTKTVYLTISVFPSLILTLVFVATSILKFLSTAWCLILSTLPYSVPFARDPFHYSQSLFCEVSPPIPSSEASLQLIPWPWQNNPTPFLGNNDWFFPYFPVHSISLLSQPSWNPPNFTSFFPNPYSSPSIAGLSANSTFSRHSTCICKLPPSTILFQS